MEATNHASSPNFPNLYLERNISFGKPHATETKCGLTFLFGSTTVENPLRNARENRRVVQQIDCIFELFVVYILNALYFLARNSISINLRNSIGFVFFFRNPRTLPHNFFFTSLLQRRCTISQRVFFYCFLSFCCWRAYAFNGLQCVWFLIINWCCLSSVHSFSKSVCSFWRFRTEFASVILLRAITWFLRSECWSNGATEFII